MSLDKYEMNKVVYVADLTHTGAGLSSDVFPYGAGMIGASLLDNFSDEIEVEVFKFPSDFADSIDNKRPDIVGFSNYSWNLNLSYDFARTIKERYPDTIILFGGPNYGLHTTEIEEFWKEYGCIDFYVVGEGEVSVVSLYQNLKEHAFNVYDLKRSGRILDGCHYLHDGKVMQHAPPPRNKNFPELPSPYLSGLMDKFWKTSLIPLIATTRGCPFSCTMCAEGNSYYNKVSHNNNFAVEIDYIANNVINTKVLNLSDANFGMYKQDVDKAKIIAKYQVSHDYPKKLLAATGKNNKENVIEVSNILNGAMEVFASLQSTDEKVLKNIKRDNINLESLNGIVSSSKNTYSSTVTELILALPGDTVNKHKKSLKDTVDVGLGTVRMYQLIMLRQSELSSPDTREKYKIRTLHRVMPRSFGRYRLFGNEFISVESEEICVSMDSMSYMDYLECREIDMAVEILHNGGLFYGYWKLCRWLNYSWFDFIMHVYERRNQYSKKIKDLFLEYRKDNERGYWVSYKELKQDVGKECDAFLANADGTNEMSKAKAKAFFQCGEDLNGVVKSQMEMLLKDKNIWNDDFKLYLDELDIFIKLQKKDIFDYRKIYSYGFAFDFVRLLDNEEVLSPAEYRFEKETALEFYFEDVQKDIFESYINIYGTESIDALGRFLMRTRMTDVLRKVRYSSCE